MKTKLFISFLAISGIANAQTIAGGQNHSLAVCNNNTAWAWGSNPSGQLGNGNNNNSNVPVQISSITGTIAITGGAEHSLALKNDGIIWAWGRNDYGQLGNGTNTNSNVPVQVSSLTGIITIAAGSETHSLALKNDSTVWAWGRNDYGQLGNGTNTSSNVPVQVSSLTGVTAIAGGYHHSLALKNDGTVWAWGSNLYGQLGNGTNTNSNIPVQVTSLTGITAIGAGYHSLALKNNGMVWAWGYNLYGELGNGTNTDSNIPVQVNSLTGITTIAVGVFHSLALKNDSMVWAWGYNLYGQLGNGTNTDSNVPVTVNSFTGITVIAAGYGHSLALKNDSTAWAWGYNVNGQLGNGTNTDSSVPVQISGICPVCTPFAFTQSPTVCAGESIIVGSNTYTVSGTYYDTLTSYQGCDSTVTTNLTVLPANIFTQSPTVCEGESVTVGSNTYTVSGTYYDTLTSYQGCDSIIVTQITINPNPAQPNITQSGNTLSCSSTATSYQWYINSNLINVATNQTYTITQSGNYTVEITDANGCKISSNSFNAIFTGIADLSKNSISISIYPNPTTGKVAVTVGSCGINAIEIYNVFGEKIYSSKVNNQSSIINLDSPSGMYFVQLRFENKSVVKKLIIEK